MDKHDLTTAQLLPALPILALFALMTWRGEVAPTGPGLYASTPADGSGLPMLQGGYSASVSPFPLLGILVDVHQV